MDEELKAQLQKLIDAHSNLTKAWADAAIVWYERSIALQKQVAELEAELANYHTHLTQGTLVWKVPPPDYYLQQFDGEGVA